MDKQEFHIVWDTVSQAIHRIGGANYEQQCTTLSTTSLDGSYQDIYREFTDLLSTQQEKMETLESKQVVLETTLKDTVPPNERGKINALIKEWEARDKLFAETRAAKYLIKFLRKTNVVVVTGSPGSGKSFTVQHVILALKNDGYDVIPVRSSTDMVRFFTGKSKQVFFIDDICGRYNILMNDIEEWERNNENLKSMFDSSLSKFVLTCRLQIYQDSKFKSLNLETFKVVNLSGTHALTLQHKQLIGKKYLNKDILKRLSDKVVNDCICFPLLCSLYAQHVCDSIELFEKPKSYFFNELNEMKKKTDKIKYACIALCVIFDNTVPLDVFSMSASPKVTQILYNVCEELEVNVTTPKKTIKSHFDSMVGSYFKKSDSGYTSIHDYLFDIFCPHVGETILECIINNADRKLISERALLESLKEKCEFAIIIPEDCEHAFFNRVLKDFNDHNVWDVFGCIQMIFKSYRAKLMSYIVKADQDVNITDKNGESAIFICSVRGYADLIVMLCERGGDVNLCAKDLEPPISAASVMGNKTCVEVLLENGAEVNICSVEGFSPLYMASVFGHYDIVGFLCGRGGNVNLCDKYGQSPLFVVSLKGDKSGINVLLDNGAKVNLCSDFGISPLYKASERGHHEIVNILCETNADVNLCDSNDRSPLHAATLAGHTSCIEVLLNNGAKVNISDNKGLSPLSVAAKHGHHGIVEILCNRGGNIYRTMRTRWMVTSAYCRNERSKILC